MIQQRLAAVRARTTRRVYFGWWVSIAGAFNMFLSSGPTFQASSVFFKAIEDEFGWSRALISGVASFGRFGGAMLGPVEGFLTDRFGSGKMVLIGFTLGGAGLIFFSQIQGPWQYYFSFFLLSLGFSMGGFVPSMTAVNAWMVNNRATGMSIVIGGSSIAGLLVPAIVWGIATYGWRPTVMVIGIAAIAVGPFLAIIIGKRPTAEQLMQQTSSGADAAARQRIRRSHDFTPAEAVRTRAFWAISMTHTLVNLSTGAISAHLFLHLTDGNGVNLDDAAAAGVMPILVITAFLFQLGGGILGDRVNKRMLVLGSLLIQGGALVILAIADSFMLAAVFAVVWGIGFGTRTPLLHAMRGEYFGRRHFGTILGLSSFPMSVGMMLAPVVMGWAHDLQGSYIWSLYVLAGTCFAASATILFATRPMSPTMRRMLQVRAERRQRSENP